MCTRVCFFLKHEQCHLFSGEEYTVPIKYVGFHNYNCNNDGEELLLHNALLFASPWLVSGCFLQILPLMRCHCGLLSCTHFLNQQGPKFTNNLKTSPPKRNLSFWYNFVHPLPKTRGIALQILQAGLSLHSLEPVAILLLQPLESWDCKHVPHLAWCCAS